jgi:histidyl-tRNA synthetase
MADIPLPRGVRDLLPNEALFRNELLKKIESVFQRFGFLSIDTPTFEKLAVLKAKGGIGEDAKLIFELKNDDLGLRYDNTMSLARYAAMHQDLPLPFKRYEIAKSWRREEPQKARYWEFTQADVDIIGVKSAAADAEIIAAPAAFFDSIDLKYRILINNRKFMDAFFAKIGVGQALVMPILRALDKVEKIGRDAVLEQVRAIGVDNEKTAKIDELVNTAGSNEDKLQHIAKFMDDSKPVTEIRETLELLTLYNLKGEVILDFSLARGFDYYTDLVLEFKLADEELGMKDSIVGGGRYDNLVGMFGGKPMPAVGSSIGVEKLLTILDYSSSSKYTYAKVLVAWIKIKNYPYALKTANKLRAADIATDINTAERNISNQLSYANSLKFKYAVIVGDGEEKEGKLKLRNLVDGSETMLSIEEAITVIKSNK